MRVSDQSCLAFSIGSKNNHVLCLQPSRPSPKVCRQIERLHPGAARTAEQKLPGRRLLPFQAKVRLLFYLAIKHSILQESLPTSITEKTPKDTLFHTICVGKSRMQPIWNYTIVFSSSSQTLSAGIVRPLFPRLNLGLDASNYQTVDGEIGRL